MSLQTSTRLGNSLVGYLKAELSNGEIRLQAPPARLSGGRDTDLFCFELDHAVPDMPRSLVIRMYRKYHGREKPLMESTVQNLLAASGYPAPRVHLVCTDATKLGQPFIIMDRLPGEPLALSDPTRSAAVLANAQADLHEIDSTDVIDALRKRNIDNYWLDNRFAWLGARASDLPVMRECVEWIRQNRPKRESPSAICHGDFHLLNVLFDGAAVSAVLDWSAFTLADPTFDVAGTLMLFHVHGRHLDENGEMRLPKIDSMIGCYLESYQARRPLDETHLEYYLALRCTIALTHCLKRPGSQPPEIAHALANEIHRVSGVQISDPSR